MMDQASSLRRLALKTKPRQDQASKCEILAVTSGKGGVGKSNISLNLGYALARQDKQVLMLDADIGTANLDILLGLDPKLTLGDVLSGDARLADIVIRVDQCLDFLPGASGLVTMMHVFDRLPPQIQDDIRAFESHYDYLITDTSAGITQANVALLLRADRVLLVCTTEPTSIVDAYAMCKSLYRKDQWVKISLIVNNVKDQHEAIAVHQKIRAAVQRFLKLDLPYLCFVTHDPTVTDSIRAQKPFLLMEPECPASVNIRDLALKLDHPKQWCQGKGLLPFFSLLKSR